MILEQWYTLTEVCRKHTNAFWVGGGVCREPFDWLIWIFLAFGAAKTQFYPRFPG
jgi:hypothetical protein